MYFSYSAMLVILAIFCSVITHSGLDVLRITDVFLLFNDIQ